MLGKGKEITKQILNITLVCKRGTAWNVLIRCATSKTTNFSDARNDTKVTFVMEIHNRTHGGVSKTIEDQPLINFKKLLLYQASFSFMISCFRATDYVQ